MLLSTNEPLGSPSSLLERSPKKTRAPTFVDLFAGLGGFHVALSQLGLSCVYACEIDAVLRNVYEQNFGMRPAGDIRDVEPTSVPPHDLLCAGFPCQPFSKAGEQSGFGCPTQGDLFDYVMRILSARRPKYLLLENVPNLLHHDNGDTIAHLRRRLRGLGYTVREERFSPHEFGVPQVRDRVYIVGRRDGLNGFAWPTKHSAVHTSIFDALDDDPPDARPLSVEQIAVIEAWQEFVTLFPEDEELPSFPIWSNEFGATYPYVDATPHSVGLRRLMKYRGSHGVDLSKLAPPQRWEALPSYARTDDDEFPGWKVKFIEQNRELYQRHKKWIRPWLRKVRHVYPSFQKFEWNCLGEKRDVWRYVIQFRASGIRVKRPSSVPSLVAMTTTQVPIIGPQRRFMTPRECARVQSLDSLKVLPTVRTHAFKALGNAVNAEVVRAIARALLNSSDGDGRPGLSIK
jgi:DNA (cytosine-5)-methyltransferase 1